MGQFEQPRGFLGRFLARGMAWGHRDFYKNTAKILDVKSDDLFLEIGFGSGIFVQKYISPITANISGIDYSEDMVNLARDINRKIVQTGKADFRHGDVSSLPWPDDEFTAVVTIETFFFWPDPETALKEIRRVLKPGGRFVLEMAYNKDDGLDHAKDVKKMNLKLYSLEEVTCLLKNAGFSEIHVSFYRGFRLPFKGYVVPKGMIVKAIK